MYFLCSILSFVLVDLWHLLQQEPIKCSSVFMLQGSPPKSLCCSTTTVELMRAIFSYSGPRAVRIE